MPGCARPPGWGCQASAARCSAALPQALSRIGWENTAPLAVISAAIRSCSVSAATCCAVATPVCSINGGMVRTMPASRAALPGRPGRSAAVLPACQPGCTQTSWRTDHSRLPTDAGYRLVERLVQPGQRLGSLGAHRRLRPRWSRRCRQPAKCAFPSPRCRARACAVATASGERSTPTTAPAGPTRSVTTNAKSPDPEPRSTTRMPDATPAACKSARVAGAADGPAGSGGQAHRRRGRADSRAGLSPRHSPSAWPVCRPACQPAIGPDAPLQATRSPVTASLPRTGRSGCRHRGGRPCLRPDPIRRTGVGWLAAELRQLAEPNGKFGAQLKRRIRSVVNRRWQLRNDPPSCSATSEARERPCRGGCSRMRFASRVYAVPVTRTRTPQIRWAILDGGLTCRHRWSVMEPTMKCPPGPRRKRRSLRGCLGTRRPPRPGGDGPRLVGRCQSCQRSSWPPSTTFNRCPMCR
jgi:hypothetical protein